MPIQMSPEQEKVAAELFATVPVVDSREGKTRLTVRFDPENLRLYRSNPKRRTPFPGLTLLRYQESPARTPSGGRYTRRALTVRTRDGRKWWGNVKKDTDIVILRLAPKEDETD